MSYRSGLGGTQLKIQLNLNIQKWLARNSNDLFLNTSKLSTNTGDVFPLDSSFRIKLHSANALQKQKSLMGRSAHTYAVKRRIYKIKKKTLFNLMDIWLPC
jgi:hypothetical protein